MDNDTPLDEKTTKQVHNDLLKWLPWIILGIIVLLGIILYFFGFRFSYNPNLENSWDAVSAVAAWASAIAALGAVAVAVIVALKQNELSSEQNRLATMQNTIAESQNNIADQQREIMEQQNKIALFEKRFEVQTELNKHILFALRIKEVDLEDVSALFPVLLGCDNDILKNNSKMMVYLKNLNSILDSASCLFSFISDEEINNIRTSTTNFFFLLGIANEALQARQYELKKEYIQAILDFDDKYSQKIRDLIKL